MADPWSRYQFWEKEQPEYFVRGTFAYTHVIFHHAPKHLSGSATEVQGTCRISLLWDIIAVFHLCRPPTTLNKKLHLHKLTCLGRVLLFHTHRRATYAWVKKDPTMGESLGTSHLLWLTHTHLLLKCWKRLSCLGLYCTYEGSASPPTVHKNQCTLCMSAGKDLTHSLLQAMFRLLLFFSPRKHDGFILPFFIFQRHFTKTPASAVLHMYHTFIWIFIILFWQCKLVKKLLIGNSSKLYPHLHILHLAKTVSLGEHLW